MTLSRENNARIVFVIGPLVANTLLGTRANWNKLTEFVNDFAELVTEREKRLQPMTPSTTFAAYSGSLDPTNIVKTTE